MLISLESILRFWRCPTAVLLMVLPVLPMVPWMTLTARRGGELGWVSEVHLFVPGPIGSIARVGELAGRISSLGALILLGAIAIAAGVVALVQAWRSARNTIEGYWLAVAWLLIFAILEYFVVVKDVLAGPDKASRVYKLLGHELYAQTLGAIAPGGQVLRLLDGILDLSNTAVIFAATSLAAIATATALELMGARGSLGRADLKRLQRRLDLILMAAAATLVTGVLLVKEWTAWPSVFLTPEGMAAYGKLVASFIGFQGLCYVGVLLAIYLPAALLLNRRIERIDAAEAERAGTVPVMNSLMRVLAVLSPLLAGPVATFLGAKLTG